MLPFLKKKDSANVGLIVKTRAPDEKPESEEDQDDPSAAHEACGQAILQAIKSNDATSLVSAIQDLLALGDGNDAEVHSYDAQNIEAGKDE